MSFPSVFVSHGAPAQFLEPEQPAYRFLRTFGAELATPAAILVVSLIGNHRADTDQRPAPGAIHDFGGFDPALYAMRYQPPGARELGVRARALLEGAGSDSRLDPKRGIDHGGWVPLMPMYPEADVPVVQLSVQSRLSAAHHHRLGQALRPLREEGVLILASGSLTHNLRAAFHWVPGMSTGAGQRLQRLRLIR
ncbi:MAG: class III extradiol ring-cleavage dioxygenase [Candidatus Competibacteraceae bacterium]